MRNLAYLIGSWYAVGPSGFFCSGLLDAPVAISSATSELRLAVLLPITGSWPVGAGLIGAVALAVEAVNSDPRILNGRRLSFFWGDDGCDRMTSLAAFSNLLEQHGAIHALIGPGCSKACLPRRSGTCDRGR